MSVAKTLADDMVTRLNAATFSQSFTAILKLFPISDTANVTSLQVHVFAGGEEWSLVSRGNVFEKQYEVGVVVRAPITHDNADIAPLMTLCEEIRTEMASNLSGYSFVEIEQPDQFLVDRLLEQGLFEAIITARFKGIS